MLKFEGPVDSTSDGSVSWLAVVVDLFRIDYMSQLMQLVDI